MQQKLSGLGLVVAALSVVWDAQGAGFELREQSATGQGASFAGVAARADDPSMIFWNPAAMAWLPGTQGAAVGSGIFPYSAARTGNASRIGGSPITGSLGGDAGVDAFVPALHATTALGAELRLGLSITSPWGLVTKYPSDFIGRYYAQTSSLRTINIAPAVSWQARPNLAFGAALQIQHASARLSQAFDFGALINRPPVLRTGARPSPATTPRWVGRSARSGSRCPAPGSAPHSAPPSSTTSAATPSSRAYRRRSPPIRLGGCCSPVAPAGRS